MQELLTGAGQFAPPARLRAAGVRCIAAHPHTNRKYLYDTSFAGDTCIVLGSEGEGIRPATLAACTEMVAVPMMNGVDSLNVGNASAVFFYEALRQRMRAEKYSPEKFPAGGFLPS